MALEKSERYVLIGIDEDSKDAQIISFIKPWTNKLDKLCKQYPKSFKHVSDQMDGDELVGREYICDKKLVPYPRVPREKKESTEEEKKIKAERLRKARQKKVKKD